MNCALHYIFILAVADTALSVKLFIGQDDAISVLDVTNRKLFPKIAKRKNMSFFSIDYVYTGSLIFFTVADRLIRATLDDGVKLANPLVIVDKEVDGPVRLAVDWLHRKLYWMADRYQTVMTADLDGNNSRQLFDNITLNFSYPNNIVVDPYERLVFFVSNYVVYKSNLDGGNLKMITIESNTPGVEERGVRAIALDRVNKKLYLSGKDYEFFENTHYLSRVNYDGTDIEDFDMTGLNDIYSMDILGDTLYFANYQNDGYAESKSCPDTVMTISTNFPEKPRPQKMFIPYHCESGVWSVKVYHPCAQKLVCDDNVERL